MWGSKLFPIFIAAAVAALGLAPSFGAEPARPASCSELAFVAIEPQGKSAAPECNSPSDKLACQVGRGFSHFDKIALEGGKTAHRLKLTHASLGDYRDYLLPLERSPAIRETNELRILARQVAGLPDPCEPNYIYVGSSVVFGMGPAFVSSERFVIGDQLTSNVIMAEDAKAPFHIPLAMISKSNLIKNSYYDIVIAHELAHGLMQDLYGVDGFAQLEKRVISRDGHMASAVTDPRLAWIEGFAEGFEAYLGEKYLTTDEQRTPYLDKTMQRTLDRVDDFNAYGWKGYLFTIPGTILRTAGTMLNIDDFVSDFLKLERQRPIRDNHYVLRGQFNNLAHNYGIPFATNELDADDLMSWRAESAEGVYSKEGVVAHFVYEVLHAGLAAEMFDTIHWAHPRDLWEFASLLPASLTPEQLARLGDAYRTTFTEKGREAVASRLKNLVDPDNRHAIGFDAARVEAAYVAQVAKIAIPVQLPPPHDLWLEFWNTSLLHMKLYGTMDRINLATATPGRVEDFLKTLGLEKERRTQLLRNLLVARESYVDTGQARTIERFIELWQRDAARGDSQLKADIAQAAAELRAMRGCFRTSCLTHTLPRE